MVVVALPWAAGAIYSAAQSAVVLGTAAYAGSVAGKLLNSGIKYTKQQAPYWSDTAGHLVNIGASDFKTGATAVGLALQESASVTTAYVRSMTNTARITPPMSLAVPAVFSPTIPFQRTQTSGGVLYPPIAPSLYKNNIVGLNYERRLVASPATIPTPADPATATLQKPVVKVNEAIKAKSWGTSLHVPLTSEVTRIQNIDIDSALTQISGLSQIAAEDFSKWLASQQGDEGLIGHKANFLNTSLVYIPDSLKIGAFAFGVASIEALSELYKKASDQATLNQATVGVSSEYAIENVAVPLPTITPGEVPLNLTHVGAGVNTQVKDSIIFPEAIETNLEDLLTFVGAQTTKEGGASILTGEIDLGSIPSREEFAQAGNVLNGETITEVPQNIKAKTVFDIGLTASALSYYRQGLHEFPMQAVSPTEVGKKVAEPASVVIPNAATLQAYNHTVTDKKIGNFPLEFEIKDENGVKVDLGSDVAEALIGDFPATEVDSGTGNLILTSLAAVTALVGTLGLQQSKNQGIGFNLLTSLSSLTAGAAAAATKAAGCACASADFLGNRSSPICTPVDLPINPGVAGPNPKKSPQPLQKGDKGNALANLLGGSQGCFPSQINDEVETVLDILRDVKYACSLIKQAVLKTPKDIEREKEALDKMTKGIKKTNKERWEKFKDAIRKDESVLNKNYPVKPKLIEYAPDGSVKT